MNIQTPLISPQEAHNQVQSGIARELKSEILDGDVIDPQRIAIAINPELDNTLIFEFAIKHKIVTKATFTDMVHTARIIKELGSVPQNPTELVTLVEEQNGMEVRFDGTLKQDLVPFTIDKITGEKTILTKEQLVADPAIASWAHFRFPKTIDLMQFELNLRILNTNLHLGFTASEIADAVTQWHHKARRERLFQLMEKVGSGRPISQNSDAADVIWNELATKIFDTVLDKPEFVVAVLKKFIWQTKRKMSGLPVTDHLMPVILGPQGVGKSTFVNKFIGPLKELSLEVNFEMIEDERNIEIWNSYILFLDEMGYASKANVDTIKHVITATHLARRPMRTNSKTAVAQNATFIGCSNKTLPQLIKDPTGMRRFVGLHFSNNPSRAVMNETEYASLWQSVDPTAADPMLPFIEYLRTKQEEDREKGRVEEWLEQFDPNAPSPRGEYGLRFSDVLKNGKISASELFLIYSEWESVHVPGSYRMNNQEFGHEMKRLIGNCPEKVPFEKGPRSSKGQTWVYTRATPNVVLMPNAAFAQEQFGMAANEGQPEQSAFRSAIRSARGQ
jgi:Virulence-associated protein E